MHVLFKTDAGTVIGIGWCDGDESLVQYYVPNIFKCYADAIDEKTDVGDYADSLRQEGRLVKLGSKGWSERWTKVEVNGIDVFRQELIDLEEQKISIEKLFMRINKRLKEKE